MYKRSTSHPELKAGAQDLRQFGDMLRVDNFPVKVSVYDEANVLLYTETLLDKSGKQFDFSNVRKGEYTILIQHKGKTFLESFIK